MLGFCCPFVVLVVISIPSIVRSVIIGSFIFVILVNIAVDIVVNLAVDILVDILVGILVGIVVDIARNIAFDILVVIASVSSFATLVVIFASRCSRCSSAKLPERLSSFALLLEAFCSFVCVLVFCFARSLCAGNLVSTIWPRFISWWSLLAPMIDRSPV